MVKVIDPTWDLEVFFKGGSNSKEFQQFLSKLRTDIESFYQALQSRNESTSLEKASTWLETLKVYEEIAKRLNEAGSFISCLRAQNMGDKKADEVGNTLQNMYASFKSCDTYLKKLIGSIPENVWSELLQNSDELKAVQFPLEEMRKQAREQLSPEQEQLINDLSVDGYHAWGDLYNTTVGQMTIHFDHPEKGAQELSVGQLANLLSANNRVVREKAFEAWEKAWKSQSEFCAAALNHLAGFRINVYKKRHWDSVLKEPLDINRMSQETLQAMWTTIEAYKPKVVEYLRRKADIFGLEKLAWHDVDAPLSTKETKVSYDEGSAFIIEHFTKFNPEMGTFAKEALETRWVEAEDRPGKRPGGFCTSFPLAKESRIFMTYSGTASNVSTLAHELGHAYHQHVMNDIPYLNQDYAMNVAETASTFAELIVSDAAIKAAKTKEEQLMHLEDKLQRAVAFFMNIHARFLFETRFYAERKKGLVNADHLNQLMLEAQKEAYCNELESYHPAFWESKLHFYITGVPFYNFPYTFGYMFSTGIYARALEDGPAFAKKYDALLRDTGSMKVEDLAKKHLGVNLEEPDFWRAACEQISKDVDLFLELTNQ